MAAILTQIEDLRITTLQSLKIEKSQLEQALSTIDKFTYLQQELQVAFRSTTKMHKVFMEEQRSTLHEWQQGIDSLRKKYFFLNFFTIRQCRKLAALIQQVRYNSVLKPFSHLFFQ